ncbi:hypothetical protein L7F22_047436 [Adiantum nelumboides]|nr:hypothetical protein [Adiantum nelumboides]
MCFELDGQPGGWTERPRSCKKDMQNSFNSTVMAQVRNDYSVDVSGLQFSYPGQAPFIADFNLHLQPGSRCLLVGANGSGKTTVLRILAGKHMVGGTNVVRVLGSSAFHDTSLICNGQLAYLGGSWSKTVGCAGEIPLQGDFSAEHMIFGGWCIHFQKVWLFLTFLIFLEVTMVIVKVSAVEGADLIDLLDIDLDWRMHKVSDGQRRRVQICMGLLQPYKVLLLDEITVDLDVVARMDLLNFFVTECKERGATVVYATHIFDGLETWATHLAHVEDGKLKGLYKMGNIPELNAVEKSKTLLQVVMAAERERGTGVKGKG